MQQKAKQAALLAISLAALLMTGCQTTSSSSIYKKDPDKAVQVRTQLAAEHLRNGDLDAAKRSLDQALEHDARHSNANMMMGVLLQQEGSPDNLAKAESYFKRAISSDPDNAQARNNYGTYLYHLARYPEAIQQLSRAGSTLGYEQRYLALENLGRVYLKSNDLSNAEASFKQALNANRDAVIAMLELAEIFYLRQDLSLATDMYQQFVHRLGTQNQSSRALWLGIRIARGNADQVGQQALVQQLASRFPNSPEYQRYLQLQHSTELIWK